jgi:3-hydroxyisobutyrate dehydrogenase-like beta-hydroxyacid dehydrogenase
MARCETCGNEYDRAFEITAGGETHVFDSFECAIQAMAPECAHCGCKVIGHGIEAAENFYCCAHCANQAGVSEAVDRAKMA